MTRRGFVSLPWRVTLGNEAGMAKSLRCCAGGYCRRGGVVCPFGFRRSAGRSYNVGNWAAILLGRVVYESVRALVSDDHKRK